MPVPEALEAIGQAIATGRPPEHFKDLLDRLLETPLEERDRGAEAAWERRHRRGGS